MSLNPFPVTDLRPELESMHLLPCACVDIIATFETHGIGLDRLQVRLNVILCFKKMRVEIPSQGLSESLDLIIVTKDSLLLLVS